VGYCWLRGGLKAWFSRAAAEVPPAAELLTEVVGDERLDAPARLDVYARMYVARLVDVLREDYPRVAAVLGEEEFTRVAGEYVAAHRSTHPSLRWFGRAFPERLAGAGSA